MTREEILLKSRLENKDFDEREQQVHLQASELAFRIGLVLCLLIMMVIRTFDGPKSALYAAWTIYFCMTAIQRWIIWIKLKKRSDLLFTIVPAIPGVLSGVIFVYLVLNGM